MSHRGLFLTVLRLLSPCAFCWIFILGHWSVQAQNADELLLSGQAGQPSQPQRDELPKPVQSDPKSTVQNAPGSAAANTASSDPADESDSAPRIYLGLEAERATEGIGVRVVTVTRDSPAWKAGLRVDDRILGINGFAIGTMEHMVEQMAKARPGQSINFLVNREGRNRDLVAVVMNADVADKILNRPVDSANAPAWLGVTSADLTNSFREQFGIAAFRGAAVTQVINNSPAYQAGVRPGDAIVELNSRPVESAADLQRWVEQAKPGDQAQVVYFRGAGRRTTKVVLVGDPQLLPPEKSNFPKAFPKFSDGNMANRPAMSSNQTAQPLPINRPLNPTTNPSTTNPASSDTIVLEQPANAPTSKREAELEAEVVQLRAQLAEAQAKLVETKQQLDNILRALKD